MYIIAEKMRVEFISFVKQKILILKPVLKWPSYGFVNKTTDFSLGPRTDCRVVGTLLIFGRLNLSVFFPTF